MTTLTYTVPSLKLKPQTGQNTSNLNNIAANSPFSANDEKSAEIVIVRKKIKMNVLNIASQENHANVVLNEKLIQQTKKRRITDSSTIVSCGKVKSPPAVSVARRNARERNRVKQVNNGFAALREHIPEEIAEVFETSGAGRGSVKKLSKVETLRMAVEYIRNLEELLQFDGVRDSSYSPNFNNTSTFSNISTISNMSESSLPATPPPEQPQPMFYAIKPRQLNNQDVVGATETQITIINGQQYIRIPGTNTFQLISHEHFEDQENIQPTEGFCFLNQFDESSATSSPPPISTQNNFGCTTVQFVNINNNNLINSMASSDLQETPLRIITPACSISPSTYSGHSSLSPAPSKNIHSINAIVRQPKFEVAATSLRHEPLADLKPEIHEFGQHIISIKNEDMSHYDNLMLKQEIIEDEMMLDDSSLSSEHMIDAMTWWNEQQQHQQNSQSSSS